MKKRSKRQKKQRRTPAIAEFRRDRTQPIVKFFSGNSFRLDSAEFEKAEGEGGIPEIITKQALVMVEGKHKDSHGKVHNFSRERIQRIVSNTNQYLESGGRVPWQQDHNKDQRSNIGDLEGSLELKVITRDDLPDQRAKHLVGKLGVFASELVAKGADVCKQILAKRIKTLSPGIDVIDDIIREISATPVPAIAGLSTFKRADRAQASFTALTWDEAEQDQKGMDAIEEEFEQLSDTFWDLIESIQQAGEEDLQGSDPRELQLQAIDEFALRIESLLGLNQQQEQGDPMNTNQARYSRYLQTVDPLAKFSLTGLKMAEFMGPRKQRKDKGKKRGLRSRLLGSTTSGRIARGVGAAALLGGAAALSNKGMRQGIGRAALAGSDMARSGLNRAGAGLGSLSNKAQLATARAVSHVAGAAARKLRGPNYSGKQLSLGL
jgi:hypothetical protein